MEGKILLFENIKIELKNTTVESTYIIHVKGDKKLQPVLEENKM